MIRLKIYDKLQIDFLYLDLLSYYNLGINS